MKQLRRDYNSLNNPPKARSNTFLKSLAKQWVNYSFVLPAAIFLLVFIAYPVLFNFRMSFQDVRAINLLNGGADWVGFSNYRTILANTVFHQAARNTLIFTAGSVVFQLAIGLALALFYNLEFPGSRWMRGLYLIAWTIPIIVVAAVFRWLFDGQVGVFNYWLESLRIINDNIFWLSEPDVALGAIIFINIWLGIPFNMALLLAGLQGIPHELYEAAEIDGASVPQRFGFITFPLLRPALFAVTLLGLIYTFKVFDVVWATTQGGPFNTTHLVATLAFRTIFVQFQFGSGAAMLNLLFVVLFGISLLYLWNLRYEEAR
ncbi:MAG: sugar ABC transporter permease [Deinococcota bacterium]